MRKPIIQYHCPYCNKAWDTEELAKVCAKHPRDILRDGDVLDWSEYRYGMVKNVHEKDDWAGFSAYKNKDYCIAIGHNLRDMFSHGGDGVCYAGAICGGKERHDRLLFPQKKIDDLVKDLDKRLKAAKNLQKQVTAMWKNREKKDEKDS